MMLIDLMAFLQLIEILSQSVRSIDRFNANFIEIRLKVEIS